MRFASSPVYAREVRPNLDRSRWRNSYCAVRLMTSDKAVLRFDGGLPTQSAPRGELVGIDRKTMRSRTVRSVAAIAGAGALIAMGGLTAACGGKGEQQPSTTTTTTTTTTPPPVSSTQNNVDPNGPNLFTPTPVQPMPTVSTHKRSSQDH